MEALVTAASYNEVVRKRTGDMTSKETPFRFFSNYVKKNLIQYALDHIKHVAGRREAIVLDLASGRGGDLGKWIHCQSPELCFATSKLPRERLTKAVLVECYDVSPESVAEAQRRYETMAPGTECRCSFTVKDCFSEEFLLRELPLSSNFGKYDVVSIQFAFHYACDTLERIDMLMAAIAGALAPEGVYIATTVDEEVLAERIAAERLKSEGLFSINFDTKPHLESGGLPVGSKYRFSLNGFVDCDEYVVPLEYVRSRAKHYGMEEVVEFSKRFESFYEVYRKDYSKNKGLLLVRGEMELATLYRTLCFRKAV
uniref:mRNA (guanine-N(7))-methyltransferase n=1 Tax=Trypanosoma congolense (strain IL3000) TaxID=1068625 RepID=G0UW43_TRYCI|nr:putative mRNA capping methyltransferase [Trypanosoma congolense IL3000]